MRRPQEVATWITTRSKRAHAAVVGAVLGLVASVGCGASDGRGTGLWAGATDTLASGHDVVCNPETPVWPAGREWPAVEELRIGRIDGEGADVVGRIISLAVDRTGRVRVLDGQARELPVSSACPEHVRTVGGRGGGPGESAQAVRVDLGPDGNIWVMDPQNDRLSVFDTAGVYLHGHHTPGRSGAVPGRAGRAPFAEGRPPGAPH